MESNLLSVLYVSRGVEVPSVDAAQQVQDIIEQSRVNNDACGVTGFLLFLGGYYCQYLEGPADAVTTTYSRIEKDARHEHCSLLLSQPLAQRRFGQNSMALVSMTTRELPGLSDVVQLKDDAERQEAALWLIGLIGSKLAASAGTAAA